MANITFYLKSENPDKKGLVSILIQITHNYKRVRLSSGEKVKPTHWNKKKQRIFENKDENHKIEYIRINKFLDETESKFKNVVSQAKLKDIELNESFLKNNLFKADVKTSKEFWTAFDEYIETAKPNKAPRTVETYCTAKSWLKKFEKAMNYNINFSDIDLPFFDKLKEFAFVKNCYSDNTFTKMIKILKSFLVWAEERDLYNKKVHKKFKHVQRDREVIYLTIDELMRLYNFDFTEKRYRITRDLYCFGCFTGLRISDIRQIGRENIRDGQIFKTIQKTQRQEVIPLNKYALDILVKYESLSTPLPYMKSDTINENLEHCCKMAGIDSLVTLTKFSGSSKIENIQPKYKFITYHTARKTFVTNCLVLGMNVKTIKNITGHKLDSTFDKYLKISEEYKRVELDNAWNKIEINTPEK
ncbi:MAG: tyrosine-type recombinase/integrase [Bacteroidota bacterium]